MCISQGQHALYTLYDIILLVPSMPFFLYHMTNPNPKFYKYKNIKINWKESKNKRENEKKLSLHFLLLTTCLSSSKKEREKKKRN